MIEKRVSNVGILYIRCMWRVTCQCANSKLVTDTGCHVTLRIHLIYSMPTFDTLFSIIAEREARRIIVLPDSGPRRYIYLLYNYIKKLIICLQRMWVGLPRGGVKTIKKKTMRLHGRVWPLQRQLFLEQETSRLTRDLKRRLQSYR